MKLQGALQVRGERAEETDLSLAKLPGAFRAKSADVGESVPLVVKSGHDQMAGR